MTKTLKLWRLNNRERLNAYKRQWYAQRAETERKHSADYRRANREKVLLGLKDYHRKRRYGVTPEMYAAKLKAQKGGCAVCGKPETGKRKNGTVLSLSIDHNHSTNQIRGLVCQACNVLIGSLERVRQRDERLRKAVAYLARWKKLEESKANG